MSLPRPRPSALLALLLGQFKSIIIGILIAAALVAGVTSEWADCIAILAIVVLNALIGFYQEYHAEQSIAALRRMTAPRASLRRDGSSRIVPASEVVPGDLIELEAGDLVAADARLIEAASLSINEASLTGESGPVEKDAQWVGEPTTALAIVATWCAWARASRRARLAVVVTAECRPRSARCRLISSASDDERTPLQRQLGPSAAAWSTLGIVALVFLPAGCGLPALELLLTSISLAVAAVPEGCRRS